MLTETKITSKLAKVIRTVHGKHAILNLHGHAMQAPGWPDWYLCTPVATAWVEMKGLATEITLAQDNVLTHLNKCGQNAYVLRFLSEQIFILEDYHGSSSRQKICGGATYKDAAFSVITTIGEFNGTRTNT